MVKSDESTEIITKKPNVELQMERVADKRIDKHSSQCPAKKSTLKSFIIQLISIAAPIFLTVGTALVLMASDIKVIQEQVNEKIPLQINQRINENNEKIFKKIEMGFDKLDKKLDEQNKEIVDLRIKMGN